MAKHVNRWKPDTCGCEIEYEWDDDDADADAHTAKRVIVACSAHAAPAGPGPHLGLLLAENRRKNGILRRALANIPRLADQGPDGTRALKDGIEFVWSYDAARVLHVSFGGLNLSGQERGSLQALADAEFGAGKILVG